MREIPRATACWLLCTAVLLADPVTTSAACTSPDWLVCAPSAPVVVTTWTAGALSGITLSNTLVSRSWVTNASGVAAFGLYDFRSMLDDALPGGPGVSLLRTLTPEATLTLNGTVVPAGGLVTSARSGAPSFTRVATNQMTACPFVALGPQTNDLGTCLAACWASAGCNIVDWIPAVGGMPAACVIKACPAPLSPALAPMSGCNVYATSAPPATILSDVSSGPFLNRTGLNDPGVLIPQPGALVFVGWQKAPPSPRFNWTAGRRGSPPGTPWPPPGLTLTASFTGAQGSPWAGIDVRVHYEMYEGSGAVSKWVSVGGGGGGSGASWVLDVVEVERLGVNPPFSPLAPLAYPSYNDVQPGPPLFKNTGKLGFLLDMQYVAFVNWTNDDANEVTPGSSQPLVTITEMPGLAFRVRAGGATWTSVRVYELLFDEGPEGGSATPLYPSSETYWGCTLGPCTPGTGAAMEGGITERRGLTMRRFISTIAPQALENPLQNHLTASDSASIRDSCTAMASVGWEMLVLSYGSGFDVEDFSPTYLARMAGDIAFCNALGIEVGGYDLIGWTRDPGNGWAALNPDGTDSGDACFASGWEDYLQATFLTFANATGLTMLETDGPYAGYGCSNASHSGHAGEDNSVAMQSRAMGRIYAAVQSAGIYINAPDSWLPWGISKMGIGYNEGTFRLADVDLISLIQRQVIYDATHYTLPSAAWSQLPMATYNFSSPFDLARFEAGMAGQLALGIATFIYQPPGGTFIPTPAVAPILKTWAEWFKTYRTLLSTGDVIHVTRPDGQGLDVTLHARAGAPTPGLFVVTNPTAGDISVPFLTVPLYYTGIPPSSTAAVSWGGGAPVQVPLDWRARAVLLNVTVPARSLVWATVVSA